jgi:tetratricopeptide (TPR) repeat protein
MWNGYNFDDNFVVYDNPTIQKGISAIPEIFTSHYWTEKDNTFGYRPIVRSTFAIEQSIWGSSPALSHLVNILLYCFCVFLAFKLIRKVFPQIPLWILFSALVLYATHPTHTEVVNSLKNREDILVFLFGLATIFVFLKLQNTKKWFWLPVGLFVFFLTCLTKENGITFAAIIPLVCYFSTLNENNSEKFFKKHFNLILSTVLLIVVSYIAIKLPNWILPAEQKILFYFENPLHEINNFSTTLATGFYTLLYYLKMLLFPYPLLFYYGYNVVSIVSFSSPIVYVSIILFFGILFFAFKNFKKNALFAFGILLFLISISVYANIVFPINGIIAERFMFIASLGFFLALSGIIQQYTQKHLVSSPLYKKNKNRIIWIVVIIGVVFSVQTINRNTQWKSYKTLLNADIDNLENSAKAQTSFATFSLNEIRENADKNNKVNSVDLEKIIYHYNKSIEIYPDYFTSMNNIGLIYLSFYNNPKTAITWFEKALKVNPIYIEANFNLATCYMKLSDTLNAKYYFNQILNLDSTHIQTISEIANIYYAQNDSAKAVELNNKIIAIDKLTDLPYINLGNYALLKQDTLEATVWWEKALQRNPNNPKLCYGMAKYFTQHGNSEKGAYFMSLIKKSNIK